MNLYPALKVQTECGSHYAVKMPMKDLLKVDFASEIDENDTLDDAVQRSLDESRVKEIVQYLGDNDDRFLSAIAVVVSGDSEN